MKALRLPTPHPGRFWFATGFRAVLRGSCSPKRSRADGGAARAWAVWSAGGPVPAGVRVDGVGSHRFQGDPSRAFALLQDPGRISGRTLPANPSRRVRAPVTAHRGPAQQNPRSVADPLLAGPAATPAGRPDLSLLTSPKASVQPNDVGMARLTPLEAFLAAAGKAS